MGKIVRLDTVFTSSNLKQLVDYDTSAITAQILSLPTLRAFYDATNSNTMDFGASNTVTKLKDQSKNKIDFATGLASPEYTTTAFGGKGGIYFNGSQSLKALGLFSGSTKGTVVVFFNGTGLTTSSSRMILSSSTANNITMYATVDKLRACNGLIEIHEANVPSKNVNMVFSYDIVEGGERNGTLYGNYTSKTADLSGIPTPRGDVNLGTWTDSLSSNNYIGYIGHVMVFDEDLRKNPAVLNLVNEYARRKYAL